VILEICFVRCIVFVTGTLETDTVDTHYLDIGYLNTPDM